MVGEHISKYQVKRQIVQGELIEDYLLIDEKGETFYESTGFTST